jgi:hypothetical protein
VTVEPPRRPSLSAQRRDCAHAPCFAQSQWFGLATGALTPSAARTQTEQGDIEISELPIRKWTQDYKEYLDSLCKADEKGGPALVHDYRCAPLAPEGTPL